MSWLTVVLLLVAVFVLNRGLLYVFELRHKVRMLEIDNKYSEIMVAEYESHVHKIEGLLSRLRWEYQLLSQTKNENPQFTKDELKEMQHYLHPDKHRGKTNDLHAKINGLVDE